MNPLVLSSSSIFLKYPSSLLQVTHKFTSLLSLLQYSQLIFFVHLHFSIESLLSKNFPCSQLSLQFPKSKILLSLHVKQLLLSSVPPSTHVLQLG